MDKEASERAYKEVKKRMKSDKYCLHFNSSLKENNKISSVKVHLQLKDIKEARADVLMAMLEDKRVKIQLDLHLLKLVCLYQQQRIVKGQDNIEIIIRLSEESLYYAKMFDDMEKIRKYYGIAANQIKLEIQEDIFFFTNDNVENWEKAGYKIVSNNIL